MFSYLARDWQELDSYWQEFFNKSCLDELLAIDKQLTNMEGMGRIFPEQGNTFRALSGLTPNLTHVVILGQDPYHGTNEANGLAFAVNNGVKLPPSLKNIFKELALEYNPAVIKISSTLESWKEQGVLLLNSALTVIEDKANSLARIGWHAITDKIIAHISENSPACVFILWGNYARGKAKLINPHKHLILEGVHPSPLSANRGFFGCNHFSRANQFLQSKNLAPINWLA